MKTAIIYYSKHGTTESVAYLIGCNLGCEPEYLSLKEHPHPDLQVYDRIILGTSIYAGSPVRSMRKFCCHNRTLLQQKVVGLFICCMNEEHEVEQMKNAFPEYLHEKAIAEGILGGEFLFDKMNFIERFITRKVTRIRASVSSVRYDEIVEFAGKIKHAIQ